MSARNVCRGAGAAILALLLLPPLLPGYPVLLELAPPEQEQPRVEDSLSEASAAPPESLWRPQFTVSAPGGNHTVEGYEIVPDSQVYGLLLADSLLGADWKRVEEELVALRSGLGSRVRLKLAIAIGEEMRLSGPFRATDQLRAEIRSAKPETSEPVPNPGGPAGTPSDPVADTDNASTAQFADAPPEETPVEELAEQMGQALQVRAQLYRQIGEAASLLGCDWPAVVVMGRLPELESDLLLPSAAYLAERLRSHRVRFNFIPLDSFVPLAADWASFITGGTITSDAAGFLERLGKESRFVEVEWPTPVPLDGFHIYQADVRNEDTGDSWTVPDAAVAPGWAVPEPLVLQTFRRRVSALQGAVGSTDADERWIRSEFESLTEKRRPGGGAPLPHPAVVKFRGQPLPAHLPPD